MNQNEELYSKTFIVIVTYNGMTWLKKCLGSIDFSTFKVVVVDNNSDDETLQFISTHFYSIHVIENAKNMGFGQANNTGISYALRQGAEQVFLLNQDAYLVQDCLEKLVTFQHENLQYGVLSPIHLDAQNNLDKQFSKYMGHNNNPNFFSDHVLQKPIKRVYEVPFVNAAAWLIHKECLLTVGGFDPIFFHYGEDNNFCQRVLYHDFEIGVFPNAYVIHDRGEREIKSLELYTNEYLQHKMRKLKLKYANVNSNDIRLISQEIKKSKTTILKALLKLQFKRAKAQANFLRLIKFNLELIIRSYNKNKKSDSHYLDIK